MQSNEKNLNPKASTWKKYLEEEPPSIMLCKFEIV